MRKAAEAFRTISEVAEELDVQKHVLRFWELKFPQIKPLKRGGGRRYYRPADIDLLRGIRTYLHSDGYTIKGVQKILRENGVEAVKLRGEASARPPAKKTARKSRATAKAAAEPAAAIAVPPHVLKSLQKAVKELEACRAMLTGQKATGRKSTTAARRTAS